MKDKRTLGEKISDRVASFGGSWSFIFIFIGMMISWIVINGLNLFVFDEPPFILLNLLLSTITALHAPIILMSQNRANKIQDEIYKESFAKLELLIVKQNIELQEIKKLIEKSESEK